jgi:hypothetical protein
MNPNDQLYHNIAVLHGIIGVIIFIAGILQFALKKGGKLHRTIGYIYFFSWIGIIITGIYIGSMIIVGIVFLGFYLCLTGIRMITLKGNDYQFIDKAIAGVGASVSAALLITGLILFIKAYYTYAILACFFSFLYLYVIGRDILYYIFKKKIMKDYGKKGWYVSHLLRMQFSFVTAAGAFTAVQNLFKNTLLNFILPALIGFIVIKISTAYFLKKANIKLT